jgi:hypothetical protein
MCPTDGRRVACSHPSRPRPLSTQLRRGRVQYKLPPLSASPSLRSGSDFAHIGQSAGPSACLRGIAPTVAPSLLRAWPTRSSAAQPAGTLGGRTGQLLALPAGRIWIVKAEAVGRVSSNSLPPNTMPPRSRDEVGAASRAAGEYGGETKQATVPPVSTRSGTTVRV